MQISSTLQNTIVPPTNHEPLKNSAETAQKMPVILASINKEAWNYVDLGEDISTYTTIDPKQEQTNQELINYLSNIMSDKTDEGKKT